MSKFYWADTHYGHENIIKYCARPFKDANHMNVTLAGAFRSIEPTAEHVYHLGDFASHLDIPSLPVPLDPKRHTLIVGNHDKLSRVDQRKPYYKYFSTLLGTSKSWRTNTLQVTDIINGRPVKILLSHEAQQDLGGCDLNLHGHHHNNMLRNAPRYLEGSDDWNWLYDSRVHLNVGVEILGYVPRTLAQILDIYQGRTLREMLLANP